MITRVLIVPGLILGVLLLFPTAHAHAHGFGERYDLPVPLWLYLYGAGATVLVSFVVIGMFMRGRSESGSPRLFNLYEIPGIRVLLENVLTVTLLRVVAVGTLGLVIATGFWGDPASIVNFSVAFIWVGWWVGLGYVFSLVGNLWALLNPWKVLFEWAEGLYGTLTKGKRLGLGLRYPYEIGVTPAIVLFFGFAWIENVYVHAGAPTHLGIMAVFYTVLSLGGMFLFGKHTWLHYGDAFAVLYRFLSKFAVTEVRVTDTTHCSGCDLPCESVVSGCVNCYDCFERAKGARQLNLRVPGVGLAYHERVSTSEMVFIVLALSTVTLDGFKETEAWLSVKDAVLTGVTFYRNDLNTTLALVAFPLIFVGAYLLTCTISNRVSGDEGSTGETARAYINSLIPIALAYNVAHFFSFLAIQGQLIVKLISDPFGWGWDLFGTADWEVQISIVGARLVWFVGVGAIVIGHVIAVYVAHVISMRRFGSRGAALRSQYPMVALMVGYTVVSLWIVAQPITEG